MLDAKTLGEAREELRAGRPVRYKGVEVPAPPEDQRTFHKARAWLLDHVGQAGVETTGPGRPKVKQLGPRLRILSGQAERLDELAARWGCSRDEAARRVIEAGLARVDQQGAS